MYVQCMYVVYYDSKLIAPVALYSTELVETGLWVIWTEQIPRYTRFLLRPPKKESNIPKQNK